MEDSICKSHLFPKEMQEFEGGHSLLEDKSGQNTSNSK